MEPFVSGSGAFPEAHELRVGGKFKEIVSFVEKEFVYGKAFCSGGRYLNPHGGGVLNSVQRNRPFVEINYQFVAWLAAFATAGFGPRCTIGRNLYNNSRGGRVALKDVSGNNQAVRLERNVVKKQFKNTLFALLLK